MLYYLSLFCRNLFVQMVILERMNRKHEQNKESEPNGYRYNDESLINCLMSSRSKSGKDITNGTSTTWFVFTHQTYCHP